MACLSFSTFDHSRLPSYNPGIWIAFASIKGYPSFPQVPLIRPGRLRYVSTLIVILLYLNPVAMPYIYPLPSGGRGDYTQYVYVVKVFSVFS